MSSRADEQRPGKHPRMRVRRRTLGAALAFLLVLAVAAAGALIHVPYVVLRPGPATDTLGRLNGKEVVTVKGHRTYPTSGSLDFTTVSMAGGPQYPVSVWSYLAAKLDPDAKIAPESDYFQKGTTSEQVKEQNAADMTGSQQSAQVVALRAAGQKVPEQVAVGMVQKGSPAEGRLQVNDVVTSIDGRSATTTAQVRSRMDAVRPGQTVTVGVRRAGKATSVKVRTAAGQEGGRQRALMGVLLDPRYTLPFPVTIDAGDVGGPSAGLMFSLAVYDKITPGALTGGQKIAGTGEMAADGTVGQIGGIQQKMVGARSEGARWFLAPAGDCQEVRGHVPSGLKVVKVSTFDDAKGAVQKIAAGQGGALPSCG